MSYTEIQQVAAVVVWYEPDLTEVRKSILTYSEQVGKVFIIDNSSQSKQYIHETIALEINNSQYVPLGKNYGIAKALNVGFKLANSEGYKYVLTMDQDSSATIDMVHKLVKVMRKRQPLCGIAAAQPDTPQRSLRVYDGITEMESVIASGNLVLMEAYLKVGGFKEWLFIDYVDCWFSLDIRRAGYKIVQVNSAILIHNLGNIKQKTLMGIKMFPTNHNPVRFYYISRNRLYTRKEFKHIFPEFFRDEFLNYIKFTVKMLLFEKLKFSKIKMMIKGRRDFYKNKTGVLS